MKTTKMNRFCPRIVLGFLLTFLPNCDNNTANPTEQNGQVADVDGNVYTTVTIGTQVWMVENLKTTKLNDGTVIPLGSTWAYPSAPAYCWYNNDISNKNIYGALYDWHAVNTGKLAPSGWRVPSDVDWTTLEHFLMTNGYNYDGTNLGNKYAKSMSSTLFWTSSNFTGVPGSSDFQTFRNKSGLNAVPAGTCNVLGAFYYQANSTYWWSSTESSESEAMVRSIVYNAFDVKSGSYNKSTGFSVRCIKN